MRNYSRYLAAILMAFSIFAMGGCASTSTQEGTGEYIDDTVITAKVKAAIFNDPVLSAAEINVETYKGIVQLSGFVSSRSDANHAVSITRKISGVKSVKDDMRLK